MGKDEHGEGKVKSIADHLTKRTLEVLVTLHPLYSQHGEADYEEEEEAAQPELLGERFHEDQKTFSFVNFSERDDHVDAGARVRQSEVDVLEPTCHDCHVSRYSIVLLFLGTR